MEFSLTSSASYELMIEGEIDMLKEEKCEEIIENVFISENEDSNMSIVESKNNFTINYESEELFLFNINSFGNNNKEKNTFLSKKKSRKVSKTIINKDYESNLFNNNLLMGKISKRNNHKDKNILEKLFFDKMKNINETLDDETILKFFKNKSKYNSKHEIHENFKNDKSMENSLNDLFNEGDNLEESKEKMLNDNEKIDSLNFFNDYINNIKYCINNNIRINNISLELFNKFNINNYINNLNSYFSNLDSHPFENYSRNIKDNMVMEDVY